MNSKKFLFIFNVIIFSLFSSQIYSQNIFAQEGGDEYEGQYYESQNSGQDKTGEINPYLNNAPVSQSTAVQNNDVSPGAQKANGSLAGNYNNKLSCPYNFERNLYSGTRGEDVRLLQTILNSDERTKLDGEGAGSAGQETTLYGPATREAIKKFQSLFIEYIGVANGNFGPKTRSVMNAVCNGENKSESGKQLNNVPPVQQTSTSPTQTQTAGEKIAPRVSLSSNLNAAKQGSAFKVIVNFSEEIKAFTPEMVIVDGGTVLEIRKLSRTSYTLGVMPAENSRTVMVQIEADKIEDLNGNLNEFASNEIIVKIILPAQLNSSTSTTPVIVPGTSNATNTDLTSVIDKIVNSAPTCNYNSNGFLVKGENINTPGCPEQQTLTPTCNYSASGQLVTGTNINTTDCAYNQAQQLANQQAQNNPYTSQQQAQQQQSQNQMYQGLGSILGKFLQGNNPFGKDNTNNANSSQNSSTQNNGANTQSNGQQTGGAQNQSNPDTNKSTPDSLRVKENLNTNEKPECKYVYKDEGKGPGDLLLLENRAFIFGEDTKKTNNFYYLYGKSLDSLNTKGQLVDKCSVFQSDKLTIKAPINKAYCCSIKQKPAVGKNPAIVCAGTNKKPLSLVVYEENIGEDNFTSCNPNPKDKDTSPFIDSLFPKPELPGNLPNELQAPQTSNNSNPRDKDTSPYQEPVKPEMVKCVNQTTSNFRGYKTTSCVCPAGYYFRSLYASQFTHNCIFDGY